MDLLAYERIVEFLTRIEGKMNAFATLMETVMADLSALQTNMNDLAAKVAEQTTVDASVATLLGELVAKQQALADEIAGLRADAVDQATIDALAQSVRDNADALAAGTAQLSAAVPQNT